MKKKFATLQRIECKTPTQDRDNQSFALMLQTGLLLALKEHGYVDDSTCTAALERVTRS